MARLKCHHGIMGIYKSKSGTLYAQANDDKVLFRSPRSTWKMSAISREHLTELVDKGLLREDFSSTARAMITRANGDLHCLEHAKLIRRVEHRL
jgi:hypothetical protein